MSKYSEEFSCTELFGRNPEHTRLGDWLRESGFRNVRNAILDRRTVLSRDSVVYTVMFDSSGWTGRK